MHPYQNIMINDLIAGKRYIFHKIIENEIDDDLQKIETSINNKNIHQKHINNYRKIISEKIEIKIFTPLHI